MLRYRLSFGALFIALIFGGLWLDHVLDGVGVPGWLSGLIGRATFPPGMVVLPVVALLAAMGGRELARILREKDIAASSGFTSMLAVLGVVLSGAVPASSTAFVGSGVTGTACGLVIVGSMMFYGRHRQVQGMIAACGGALLAFAYVGLMLGFLVAIRREYSAWMLLWVLAVTKSSDIGAYFTGRSLGRNKLAPWLSPGKTWEGAVGGMVFSAVVAVVAAWALSDRVGLSAALEDRVGRWDWAVLLAMGAVFSVVGQIGDLLASLLKRDAGRKDAGHSLPGFGGVLDVVDSPMLVAPVAFWSLLIVMG